MRYARSCLTTSGFFFAASLFCIPVQGNPRTLFTIDQGKPIHVGGASIVPQWLRILGSHTKGGVVVLVDGRDEQVEADCWLLLHVSREGKASLVAKWNDDAPGGDGVLWNVENRRISGLPTAHVNESGYVLCSFQTREASPKAARILCKWDGKKLHKVVDESGIDGVRSDWLDFVLLDSGRVVFSSPGGIFSCDPKEKPTIHKRDDAHWLWTDGRYVVGRSTNDFTGFYFDGSSANKQLSITKVVKLGGGMVGCHGQFADFGAGSKGPLQLFNLPKNGEVTTLIRADERLAEINAYVRYVRDVAVSPSGTVVASARISPRSNPAIEEHAVLRWKAGKWEELLRVPSWATNDVLVSIRPNESVVIYGPFAASEKSQKVAKFRSITGRDKKITDLVSSGSPIAGLLKPVVQSTVREGSLQYAHLLDDRVVGDKTTRTHVIVDIYSGREVDAASAASDANKE